MTDWFADSSLSATQATLSLVEQLEHYLKGRWTELLEDKGLVSLYVLKVLDSVGGCVELKGNDKAQAVLREILWTEGVASHTISRTGKASSTGAALSFTVSALSVRLHDGIEPHEPLHVDDATVLRAFDVCCSVLEATREGDDDERNASCTLISALANRVAKKDEDLLVRVVRTLQPQAVKDETDRSEKSDHELGALLSAVQESKKAALELHLGTTLALAWTALRQWEPANLKESAPEGSDTTLLLIVSIVEVVLGARKEKGALHGTDVDDAREFLENVTKHPLASEALTERAMAARARLRVLR